MIGSFLYNAAFAPKEKDNVSSGPAHGRTGSAAWFFFVACILSIVLRMLDQWLFTDEDAGTSELCAFGAFVVGAVVSMKSRTGTTLPVPPPLPGKTATPAAAYRGVQLPITPPRKISSPRVACSDEIIDMKKGSELCMQSPSIRRIGRKGSRDATPVADEAAIQTVLGCEDVVDPAALAQGIAACCKLGKMEQAEQWLSRLLGGRAPPGLTQMSALSCPSPVSDAKSGCSIPHIIIEACLGAGNPSRASAWLGRLQAGGFKPAARTIAPVLESLARIGERVQVEHLLSRLVAAHALVDASCYQTLFEHCIPKDDTERIQSWLQKSKEVGLGELSQVYLALIRARAQEGDAIQAERWLLDAIDARAAKSTHCYNAVIHACVRKGDIARAERWLEHMERVSKESVLEGNEQRFAPDVISYSAIMDAYAQQGKTEQAEAWFARMIGGGVRPDSVSFNTVIKAHARSGNISGAERWLRCARKHKVVLDSFGYNAVIAAAARANEPETAQHWLGQMLQDGAQPDVVSYNSVINAWAKRGAASAAERLVSQMCDVHVEPDVVTLGAATHACAKAGDADRAEAIFERILSRGKTRPDGICYNALIDACVKAGDIRRAEARLSEMLSEGVAPSVVSYTTVLHAHARNGDVEAAERGLERMLDAGVEANVVSYSALIGACVKAGDVGRAERWFERMQKAGIRANNVSYSVLLNVCAKAGDSERAEKWLETMCAEGVVPNAVCFNNVIDACAKAGLPDRAEMWLRRMCQGRVDMYEEGAVEAAAASIRPTRQSFTTAAQAYATRGAWLDTERIMSEMEARGITMDEFSLTVLLSAYSRGRPRQRERGEAAFRKHVAAGLLVTKPPLRVLRSLVGVARFDALCAELHVKVPREHSLR